MKLIPALLAMAWPCLGPRPAQVAVERITQDSWQSDPWGCVAQRNIREDDR